MEKRTFGCNRCSYTTRHGGNFKRHLLTPHSAFAAKRRKTIEEKVEKISISDKIREPRESVIPTNFEGALDQKIIALSDELRQILNSRVLSESEKATLYQETLRQMIQYKNQREVPQQPPKTYQPPPPPTTAPPPPPPATVPPRPPATVPPTTTGPPTRDDILRAIPQAYRKQARQLLKNLQWDTNGQIVFEKRPIPHSDVIKLLRGHLAITKLEKTRAKLNPGWRTFKRIVAAAKWTNY